MRLTLRPFSGGHLPRKPQMRLSVRASVAQPSASTGSPSSVGPSPSGGTSPGKGFGIFLETSVSYGALGAIGGVGCTAIIFLGRNALNFLKNYLEKEFATLNKEIGEVKASLDKQIGEVKASQDKQIGEVKCTLDKHGDLLHTLCVEQARLQARLDERWKERSEQSSSSRT